MTVLWFLFPVVLCYSTIESWKYFKPIVEEHSFNQVTLALSPTRGLCPIALVDLYPGDLIMSIPIKYIIACQDDFPFKYVFEDLECPYRLMARLMYDKWVNPMPGLPADYSRYMTEAPYLYYFWDKESQEYIDHAFGFSFDFNYTLNYASSKILFRERMLQIPRITEICSECLTETAFNWAFGTVQSRIRDCTEDIIYSREEKVHYTLHPVLDLFNHKALPRNTKLEGVQIREVAVGLPVTAVNLYADRVTWKGKEVFITYESGSNIQQFGRYGMSERRNPDDFVALELLVGKPCHGKYIEKKNTCQFKVFPGVINPDLLLQVRQYGRNELPWPVNGYAPITTNIYDLYRSLPKAGKEFERQDDLQRAVFNIRDFIKRANEKCGVSYRNTRRRIRENNYTSVGMKKADQLCEASWETVFSIQGPLERFLLFSLLFELGLKR